MKKIVVGCAILATTFGLAIGRAQPIASTHQESSTRSSSTSSSATSTTSTTGGTATIKCSVSPSTVAVGATVTATDNGSTAPQGSTLDAKKTFAWGDGTHTDTTTASATHQYSAAGTYEVNETVYGNFGDGHETDECTGSPVTVNPPPPAGTATAKCSVSPSTAAVGATVTATDTGSTASQGSTLDANKTFTWGDGTHTDTTTASATHQYAAAGTYKVEETVYGNFGDGHETDECTGSPVTVVKPPPPPTCSTGGLQGATFVNSDKNEDGPVSGPIHTQLEPAVDGLKPVVHEVNCDIIVSLGL